MPQRRGTTLALGATDAISTSSLGGTGTVEAGTVVADGALALTPGQPLTVIGTFAQAGSLTVDLGTIARKMPAGDYPVLAATAFSGLDLASWRIVSALPGNRRFSLVLRDGTVCLRVANLGMLIIVK